jgi:hypothetical protein
VKTEMKMVTKQEQKNRSTAVTIAENSLSLDSPSWEDKALLEEFWRLVANIAWRLLTKDNGEDDNCDVVKDKESEQ